MGLSPNAIKKADAYVQCHRHHHATGGQRVVIFGKICRNKEDRSKP